MIVMEQELFYTITEVAKLLRVSDETVRRMIKTGDLFATRVRGQWRIYATSVTPYLKHSEPEEKGN